MVWSCEVGCLTVFYFSSFRVITCLLALQNTSFVLTWFNHGGRLCVMVHNKLWVAYGNLSILAQKNHKTGLFTFIAVCWVKWYPIFPSRQFWASCHFQFWGKKCFILRMHWHIVMKLGMCLRHHALKVLKRFWGQCHLVVKNYLKKLYKKIYKLILPIVLIPLDHDENIDINYVIIVWTSSTFLSMLKTYFFDLHLDRCSDFHQIWLRSSSDHAGKKLWISCQWLKWFSFFILLCLAP